MAHPFVILFFACLPGFALAQNCACCKKRDAGQAAYDRGDYPTALAQWQEALQLPKSAQCPDLKDLIEKARSKSSQVVVDQAPDRDKDGTPDPQDDCPDTYGLQQFRGCPDSDQDGMPDIRDACPDQAGTKAVLGCPDRDGDGVADKYDLCPNQPGSKGLSGCPDRDGDGVIDSMDHCPDLAGTKRFQGCPDRDGDAVPDYKDSCPDTPGPQLAAGCPDRDKDGIPDKEDKCPDLAGISFTKGCPEEKLALIREGTFQMGSKDGDSDEQPVHPVAVSSFYLSKYEVTLADFKTFVEAARYQTDAEKIGSSDVWNGESWDSKNGVNWRHDALGNTRLASESDHPVIHVSWNDATEYCNWLARKTNRPYRLPTESEWEYAGGGGDLPGATRTMWAGGASTEAALRQYANFMGTSDPDIYPYTAPVGYLQSNRLGLHDMSGNVWEWCSDGETAYILAPETTTPPVEPVSRALRGGGWGTTPQGCRIANRYFYPPTHRGSNVGFRVALSFQ